MSVLIAIPARYASTRYPGKPLVTLRGPDGEKSLIRRSWEAAMAVTGVDRVVVATDDDRIRTRFRPDFFPYTEPSAELAVSCIFCEGRGCRVCSQSGWIELGGCGMVDPNVLAGVGIDPEEYTGFAFGFGLERIAMVRYDIDEIKTFFDGDVRFLAQY